MSAPGHESSPLLYGWPLLVLDQLEEEYMLFWEHSIFGHCRLLWCQPSDHSHQLIWYKKRTVDFGPLSGSFHAFQKSDHYFFCLNHKHLSIPPARVNVTFCVPINAMFRFIMKSVPNNWLLLMKNQLMVLYISLAKV